MARNRRLADYTLGVTTSIIGSIIYSASSSLYTSGTLSKFFVNLGQVLTLKTPLWATLIFFVLAFAVFVGLQKYRNKKLEKDVTTFFDQVAAQPIAEPAKLDIPKTASSGIVPGVDNLIFDSNVADETRTADLLLN